MWKIPLNLDQGIDYIVKVKVRLYWIMLISNPLKGRQNADAEMDTQGQESNQVD
jgi:hypothetical protein